MNPEFLTLGWEQFIQNPINILFYAGPISITLLGCLGIILYSYYRRRQQDITKSMAEIETTTAPQTPAVTEADPDESPSRAEPWLLKLKQSLAQTRSQLASGLSHILTKDEVITEADLTKLYAVLIRADLGTKTTDALIAHLRTYRGDRPLSGHNVTKQLATHMVTLLHQPTARPPLSSELQVILITGVNGVGKTTTTGKLGHYYQQQGKKTMLCAADTFRAGATAQLKAWGDRLNLEVAASTQGADPAAVCYQAVERALKTHMDVLLIDTAGRLHNKANLMAELAKINRVIKKLIPNAPHETWLVLDGTTGQNAAKQAAAFTEILTLTGLIVTKLDGTAKGGAVVGISHQLNLPIQFVGIGEQAQDLNPFDAETFVAGLLGCDDMVTNHESSSSSIPA